jgi:hypothetical protein
MSCSGRGKGSALGVMSAFVILVICLVDPIPAVAGTGCDGAGNCYVRAGATGTGTGANWTNAYSGFGTSAGQINPSGMTRGVTYWLALGSYGSPKFGTADSGTSVITIKSATSNNHGAAADWSVAYAGVTTFAAATAITTDYWTLSGQSWPPICSGAHVCGAGGYSIYFHNTTDGSSTGKALAVSGNGVTLQYVEVQGLSNGTSDDGGIAVQCPSSGVLNNFYLGYSYVHDVGVDLIEGQYRCGGQNYSGSGHTYEHNYFSHSHRGDSSAHAQAIATGAWNLVVRYNVFHDIGSSGCITDPFSGDITLQNWDVYGNTYEWDNTFNEGVGNGLVGLYGEAFTGHLNIYNNTIANINNATCTSAGVACNSPALYVGGTSLGSSGTVTAQVYNNLWWNPFYATPVMYSSPSTWTALVDYNTAYCATGGCSNSGTFVTLGAHDAFLRSGNPFVNFDGSSNFNTSLTLDTAAGMSLSVSLPTGCTSGVNCYSVDPLGVTRGADGTWDRGAFQVGSTRTPPPPQPPSALTLTVK